MLVWSATALSLKECGQVMSIAALAFLAVVRFSHIPQTGNFPPLLETAPVGGCRTIVVGAGIAGLAAAQSLLRASNCSVVVLEARAEIGGRTHTLSDGPFAGVELGAHWVHGGRDNLVSAPLLAYLGIDIVPVGGDDNFEGARRNLTIVDGELHLNATSRREAFRLFKKLHREMIHYVQKHVSEDCSGAPKCRSEDFPLERAWQHAVAALRPAPSAQQLRLLEILRRLQWQQDEGDEISEISSRISELADYTSFYPKGGKGDAFVVGGYSRLVQALASGVDVRLAEPVVAIEHHAAGVTVSTAAGQYTGDHAIITPPAHLVKDIKIRPDLPTWKAGALQRIGRGPVAKLLVALREPLEGSDDMYSFIRTGSDADLVSYCVRAGAENRLRAHILECFLGRNAALRAEGLTEAARRAVVEQELQQAFSGVDVVETKLTQWIQDPHIGLAWSFAPVGTVEKDFSNYRKRVGRLHFAGEGACRLLYGNVHAALASAGRAAYEVLPKDVREAMDQRDPDWPVLRRQTREACDKEEDIQLQKSHSSMHVVFA